MLLLFLLLLFLHKVSPHRLLPFVCEGLKPAVNFSLSTVGIFMTPCFITLPVHSSLTLNQIGLICAWFLPPVLITWTIDILLCKLISKAIPFPEEDDEHSLKSKSHPRSRSRSHGQSRRHSQGPRNPVEPRASGRLFHPLGEDERWITTPEPEGSDSEDEEEPVRRRAVTLDQYTSQVRPVTLTPSSQPGQMNRHSSANLTPGLVVSSSSGVAPPEQVPSSSTNSSSTAENYNRENTVTNSDSLNSSLARELVRIEVVAEPMSTPAPSPETVLSQKLTRLVDLVIYVLVFFIGVALFYTPGGKERSQVIFIAMISLIWLFSRRIIPHSWTKVLHPTLTTSLLASFAILGIGATRGLDRQQTYNLFYLQKSYLEFLNPLSHEGLEFPGAGDILESMLDAGTVGLAFTIFDYRRDLYHNFFRILIIVIPNCTLYFLLWPFLAHKIGMIPTLAIDFAGRSMSAPLALELFKATGGDRNMGIILVYLTGITVTVLRTPIFKLFQIRPASLKSHEDYFTIGVTVGAIGGVIGTSSLLKRHRRAAGTATITLVMFAVIMLCLGAVPKLARFLTDLAGKSLNTLSHSTSHPSTPKTL
ncbi:hypothetical protein CROQUDRAFT_64980 [Cronartium quercuum f. sp. fusiforme G11]|uniref:Uncharacterized protein n=1 Tax=Cronartium quercuum f. sp. fusiforme G11 TaxID=708437 RepID=A0A9P6NJ28_9BASI|nr:hypothetical protein CROQUDRAFT_64980 [Cronartium quercuum f. sp. fusiforme G11]